MTSTIRATFDGKVFRPSEPVDLPPNTEVELTLQPPTQTLGFLDTAERLTLDGPADWSERWEEILQDERSSDHD